MISLGVRPKSELKRHKATVYLGERQRTVEMLAALYAAWYGCIIGFQTTWGNAEPLSWMGFDRDDHILFSWFLLIAACAHGIGIEINGRRWWSPMLRVSGLSMHLFAISMLFLSAGFGSSAATNYSFVVGLLAFGVRNAAGDALKAWRNHGRTAN